jgi:hypothetical protein
MKEWDFAEPFFSYFKLSPAVTFLVARSLYFPLLYLLELTISPIFST